MISIIFALHHHDTKKQLLSLIDLHIVNYQLIPFQSERKHEKKYLYFIELNDQEDLDTAKMIRKYDEHSAIILISEHTSFVFESFMVKPLFFLRKKDLENDFSNNIDLIKHFIDKQEKELVFKQHGFIIHLNIENICYIESIGHYQYIYTDSGVYQLRKTITALEKKLSKFNFQKIHRSYIVPIAFIKKIENNEVLLKNHTKLPLSNSYKNKLKKSV